MPMFVMNAMFNKATYGIQDLHTRSPTSHDLLHSYSHRVPNKTNHHTYLYQSIH